MEIITTLLRYILLYIAIISGSIFMADKANKKIEKCIGPNIIITILVLYIFGIFELLKYGVWVIVIVNVILGLYTLIKNIRKKQNLKEKILTPGFAFWTIAFFVLLLVSYNKNLVDYDHYSYRSLNTKKFFYTDSMSKDIAGLYPPAINLIGYYFMKIIGNYNQGVEAFAMQIFGLSILIPIFDTTKNNKFVDIIKSILIICIPAILGNLIFYESAYPDAVLGLMIGYCMYILYENKGSLNKFNLLCICLALMVTTITKPIGFYVSMIIIGMYTLIALINYKCNKIKNIKKFLKSKELRNIILMFITIIIVLVSWKIFANKENKYDIAEASNTNVRVEGNSKNFIFKSLFTTIFGYYEENHDAADSNNDLIPALYTMNETSSPVRLSIYGTIIVLIIFSLVTYKYVTNDQNKQQYRNIFIALIVGMIVYIIFLQLAYILKFTTEEMLGHNGFNRYMATYLLGMIYFLVAAALKDLEEKNSRKLTYIILTVIVLAFTPLQSIANVTITSGISNIQSIEYCNNGRIPANNIKKKIGKDEKVITISQQIKTNLYNFMLRYYLYPDFDSYLYNNVNEDGIKYIKDLIIEENIKYIYIFSTDENLNDIMNNGKEIKEKTFYEITVKENEIQLQ